MRTVQRATLHLQPAILDAIDRAADREGRSRANMVRILVARALALPPTAPTNDAPNGDNRGQ